MEKTPGLNLTKEVSDMTAEYLDSMFEKCYKYLKIQVSYIFERKRIQPMAWLLGTWSLCVQRSSILKKGTQSDWDKLPPAKMLNRAREDVICEVDGTPVKRCRLKKKNARSPNSTSPTTTNNLVTPINTTNATTTLTNTTTTTTN